MTDKTMPKRIWAYEQDGFRDFEDMSGWEENGIESDFEGAEYVRADAEQGSPDESIADGQFRWVRKKHTPDLLEIARVSVYRGHFFMNDTYCDVYTPDQYDYIGPVIPTPEQLL